MTIPTSSNISTNRQINLPDTTPANKASNSSATSLQNVQKGQQASDTEEILVRAARSNGVSKTRAAHTLERQNLPVGPNVKSNSTTPTPQLIMPDNQVNASFTQSSTTTAGAINQDKAAALKTSASGNDQPRLSNMERDQTKAALTGMINMMAKKTDKASGVALSEMLYFTKGTQGEVFLQKFPT